MTIRAFVLVETAVGKSSTVVESMKQLKGIKSADIVTGPYDIIAVVEGESLNDIGNLVTSKVQSISGISRTVTCLAV
jgi:DNA-binding Lrp family transcriptional regulator